ncbi:MAG TPA: hypothetical protein VGL81_24570 [Polyangiaceae bacterium]
MTRMYKIAVEQSDGNKITPAKGDTLASICASDKCEPGTTWQRIALYNWGTVDPNEVNRALVELVGCSKVDDANPEKSLLDPDLGTTKAIYIPKTWTPPTMLAVEKTHTVKLRRRLPPPAAVLTKVDPWFIPETESCDVGYRIEGVVERADKLDFDVYASNYCKATPTADDGFFKYAFAALDVPIRQKRAFTPATIRKADTITDWKGESEAKDGMLKPRSDEKKRYVDVACSPYTVVIRYYKADADKDARITLKSFWPRFKKVLKSATDTDGVDGAAEGLKAKTEAALKAARDLDVATRIAEADVAALVAATERAALRAHAAVKAANKAATDADTAKTAVDKVKTDAGLTKVAYDTNAVDKAAKWNDLKAAVTDAKTKANTAKASTAAAAAALEVAKAAAAQAKAKAAISKASKADAATKAETAKTKVGEAKTAATAPKTLKELAETAATKADTAKTKADAAKSAADTASTSATQCDSDAASPTTKAGEARTDAKAVVDAFLTIFTPPNFVNIQAQAATAATNAGTAKTKADATKPLATTLQTDADTSRTDAAKVIRAVAEARAEALALLAAVDATDDEVVYDKSLKVTWKIEKTDTVKNGQLLILDKEDKVVFRKPLKDSDLTKDTEITCDLSADDQAKYWLDEKTKADLSPSRMPYRAQVQAHSGWDEANGVALVAMHTEVRLWAHKDNGTHTVPREDSPSLRFGLSPFRPDKDPPGAGTDEWYRLKLAEAGFHPGAVITAASTGAADPYQVALAEFQRSFPKEEKKPFTRLTCDGAKNGPTKDVLERTDIADKAHTKSVDIKAKTKATLDAADAAKVDAEKASTEADAAQTDAAQASTLADEAATLADTAATDTAAAKDAVDQAKTDTDAAAEAQKASASDAATKAQTAVTSTGVAATKAATAADSATKAADKATAAKNAADTAATKAGAAKTSTSDTAAKIATVKTKAGEAKTEAATAEAGVKDPVVDCDTKSGTADTSAKTSKASGEAADTSTLASKTDAAKAVTAADKAKADTATLKAAADQLKSSVQGNTLAQAQGLAASAATDAATAKGSADKAKLDVGAFKGKAAQGKVDADKVKADAAQAKTDALAVALAAKTADNAAEADRSKKKQRKDDVDKIFRPVRQMFGNPADRADYTRAQAEPLVGDKSKELIVWVDDRHYYDDGAEIPEIKVGDYRGGMTIGDTKVDKEKTSVARPWIPLEAQLPLLGKGQALDATGEPPVVTDAMRRAIGPVRVDWTFEELPPEVENTPGAGADNARVIAAYSRAVTVKEKTALALTAAGEVKAAATAPVTKTTAAQTELGKLVTSAGDAVPLVTQAASDAAAAQAAADTAKSDVEAAAIAAASVASDAASKGEKAKQSCALAATKAATAVQSATTAAAKVSTAKTDAAAMATEAGHAKTEATKLADKVGDFQKKLEDADIAADIAASAGAVTTALSETSKAAEKSRVSAGLVKADTEAAETSCNKCRDDAVTAETAANLVRSRADTLKATADRVKEYADAGTWEAARAAAGTAAVQAGEAKSAGDQAKTDVTTLKTDTEKAKVDVDKAKTDADKAKPDAEAIEPKAQTADTEAEADKLSRQAAADVAAGNIDPAVAASQGTRARAYVAHMLGKDGMGKVVDGNLYTNCPATAGGQDYGGIRPDPLDTYYKAAFGIDKTASNRPWLGIDDTTNKVICSVVHDDLGQDEAQVFAASLGKAGIYLNPSRIAGDGYRYRAQVSFKELPADSHPNREALLGRYVRPPASHTAALRLWRKSAFRGYVRWTPADEAGWQAVMTEVREIYHAARVHFVHAGTDPNAATEYPLVGAVAPDELITAAEYQDCINGKVSGPYSGLASKYTAGYIWPYLDQPHWGVPEADGKIQKMIDYFYAGLMNDTWRKFRAKLLHLVLKKIEANSGSMRGHTLVEFKASPKVVLVEYKCTTGGCPSVFTEVANDPGGVTVVDGQNVTLVAANSLGCAEGCGGTYVEGARRVLNGFPLAAVGCALGGTWLFTPRDADVWAHELGHHRHLEHAQANSGKDEIAPGGKVGQHDSEANAAQAIGTYTNQKFWDRWCIMSYDDQSKQHFCGKCLLKTAGWRVESLTNPAGTVSDA